MLFEGFFVVHQSAPLELALDHAAFFQNLEILLRELKRARVLGLGSRGARDESAHEQQSEGGARYRNLHGI
jgi:hypothetical protein